MWQKIHPLTNEEKQVSIWWFTADYRTGGFQDKNADLDSETLYELINRVMRSRSRGAQCPGRRITRGRRKVPRISQVIFVNTDRLIPNDHMLENGGHEFVSFSTIPTRYAPAPDHVLRQRYDLIKCMKKVDCTLGKRIARASIWILNL